MRKRFELMARDVANRFKACVHVDGVNARRARVDVVNVIHKSLQQDVKKTDISHIINAPRSEVDSAIVTAETPELGPDGRSLNDRHLFDISTQQLLKEFQSSPRSTRWSKA